MLFEVKSAVGSDAEVAVKEIAKLRRRGIKLRTLGADRGYWSGKFIEGMRRRAVIPHPAPIAGRNLQGVKVRSTAHQLSQKCRRKIEEIFGWAKTTGCFRKSRYLGVERTHAAAQYVVAACNLVRMAACPSDRRTWRGRNPPRHARGVGRPRETRGKPLPPDPRRRAFPRARQRKISDSLVHLQGSIPPTENRGFFNSLLD